MAKGKSDKPIRRPPRKGRAGENSKSGVPQVVGYGVVFLLLGTVCARLYSAYKKGTPTSGHTSHEHDSVAVDDPKIHALVDWVQASGGAISKHIEVRDGKLGRGIFTNARVKKGDFLYKVPEEIWLTEASLRNSKRSRFAAVLADPSRPHWLKTHNKLLLAFGLECERNTPRGHWGPYIDALPTASDTASQPLFWTDDQLAGLQTPVVISQINTARDFLRDRYDEVMPYLRAKAPDVFDHRNTLESFKRSYFSVASRAFDLAMPDEEDEVLGLVPFVDLVNHGFGTVNNNKMVMRMPARLRSYTVAAPTRLRSYKEVLQNYKADLAQPTEDEMHNPMHYLYTYGFLDDRLTLNRLDYVTFGWAGKAHAAWSVRMDGSLPEGLVAGIRATAHGACHPDETPTPDETQGETTTPDETTGETTTPDETTGETTTPDETTGETTTPDETTGETQACAVQVLRTVNETIASTLESIPTSLEEDLAEYNNPHDGWKHSALILRIRFKRLARALLLALEESRREVERGGSLTRSRDNSDDGDLHSMYRFVLPPAAELGKEDDHPEGPGGGNRARLPAEL